MPDAAFQPESHTAQVNLFAGVDLRKLAANELDSIANLVSEIRVSAAQALIDNRPILASELLQMARLAEAVLLKLVRE